jgi:membrane-bound inhibitor of C-type lysozyme
MMVLADEGSKDKSKRKVMSQLDEFDRGMRNDAVRYQCGVNKLMICFT